MKIRRYGIWDDDFALIDDVFGRWARPTFTFRGEWYNPDTHELVPKPEYRKSLAEEKKKEIDRLEKESEKLKKELKELQE